MAKVKMVSDGVLSTLATESYKESADERPGVVASKSSWFFNSNPATRKDTLP